MEKKKEQNGEPLSHADRVGGFPCLDDDGRLTMDDDEWTTTDDGRRSTGDDGRKTAPWREPIGLERKGRGTIELSS